MSSNDKHAQLIEFMKVAEKEAQQEESFFLVELVTAATQDETAKYNLTEIYEALKESQAWSLLDPLNLLPLLVPSDNAAAPHIIRIISQESSAKESAIAVQEAFERLKGAVVSDVGQTAGSKRARELLRLIEVCENTLPRLKLRKKGPAETLEPILDHLGSVIESIAPSCTLENGRKFISSVSRLIDSVIPWLSQNSNHDELENKTGINHLADLLYSTLSSCAYHIRAALVHRQFEALHPRLVLRSAVLPESEHGFQVVQEAVGISRSLGITSENLVQSPIGIGQLILLAHGFSTFYPHCQDYLKKLLPIITSSLQQNVAVDEALALLFSVLSPSNDSIPEDIVEHLATLLTPLASTHPDPPSRLVTFRILSLVLTRAPPPVQLAHLSSLITDCPFPQMRVAAVGLVKDAFLNAVENDNIKSPFASPSLVRAFGPAIFRPNPPDLFSDTSEESLKRFLETSEPSRLTECLAFYYVLLKRDTSNSTGIKDRDVLKTVEGGLLAPLRDALAIWLGEASSVEDPHILMPLASLETSLERVDGAILSLRDTASQSTRK